MQAPHPAVRALSLAALAAALAVSPLAAQRGRGDIKPGPWNTASKLPDGWVIYESRYYQVQSQAGIEKAKRLAEHMEVMNAVYRSMFRPDKGGAKRQAIKLLKDREAFLAYGAPPGAGAYYSPTEREMVCYDTGKWSDEDKVEAAVTGEDSAKSAGARRRAQMEDIMKMDILGAAAHEGWHQYFHWYVVSWVELPSWINEGMGDYFYTASPRETKGRKKKADLGGKNGMRLAVLKAAVKQDRFVPLADLIKYTKADYYSNASICYAEGWGLCQFLLHSGNKKYEKVVPLFVRLVRDDTNMQVVTERAFKGVDMAELQADFLAWLDKQTLLPEDEVGDDDGKDGEKPGEKPAGKPDGGGQ
ncbi:MAG: DUF1570 domain-containing protein [Planctomycetes bacterium]|nr:DUF1570 domain-containing protein [Planctomycetota bacterium]